eukprot:1160769-Pelagomonas_calceolata.AAC.5
MSPTECHSYPQDTHVGLEICRILCSMRHVHRCGKYTGAPCIHGLVHGLVALLQVMGSLDMVLHSVEFQTPPPEAGADCRVMFRCWNTWPHAP